MELKKKSNISPVINNVKPMVIYATNGGFKGEINLQWDSLNDAKSYVVQLSPNKTNNWRHIDIINDPSYTVIGLKPGKTYFFRVAPVFRDKQGAWSDPVSKKVK